MSTNTYYVGVVPECGCIVSAIVIEWSSRDEIAEFVSEGREFAGV